MLWISRRRKLGSEGMTLPEILVVISILGILGAIAVPTFIGAKRNGNDSLAQANVKTALAAERTYYVDYQSYTPDAGQLKLIESQLNFTTTDAEAQGVMAATPGANPQAVVVGSWSESGTLFCMMNVAVNGVGTQAHGVNVAGTYYFKKDAATAPSPFTYGSCATTAGQWVSSDDGWQS